MPKIMKAPLLETQLSDFVGQKTRGQFPTFEYSAFPFLFFQAWRYGNSSRRQVAVLGLMGP